jgi:CheY-like chemotaxis protein
LTSKLTVLYAEDDPDIQMIASMALGDIGGFNVSLCENGEEAVAQALTVKPDLILLDVMMPKMDGPAAFLKLQSLLGDTIPPVVFITAKASS